MQVKGLTATIVFETSAINRDENLAGNIASIKKLSRSDGTYSFLSRGFIRHHLFQTLNSLYDWMPAPVNTSKKDKKGKEKEVIQFYFPEANIVSYPEMDLFGFMVTGDSKKQNSQKKSEANDDEESESSSTIIRKAPLGITKAISLEPWQADMAFYANHDMVKRAQAQGLEANPNPFSKEEHYSYYRVSFTLDLYRFGYQDIFIQAIPDNFKKWVSDLPKATRDEVENVKQFRQELPEKATWYKVQCSDENCYGLIGLVDNKNASRITFAVNENEHKKRVTEVLTVLKNGSEMHSSTEDYGLVPVFFVAGVLKVPVPVFNSFVLLNKGYINTQTLNKALNNEYVVKAWYDGILPLDGELSNQSKPDIVSPWSSVQTVLDTIYPKKEQ
ncbi:CRISPR-associated autoregulator, Cst2 family [Thermosyntropha lipolytica DSM 11003]|uniref:CRISPR-associated autoregulator, Cst2 family n=1 Tax=Thermosyntropha lipolytica DSM 11003 TaxID=1123382 RepID=A0A1M5Q395_9FIRM|nr:type I-B CRISPR-associated protein Cas7/Cst2/DevR [Thermosyntropha lipolytica]SHH08452.1 CRISPR-associated autoregulator, Cst2 family [Thermosyntropha lipolytica DSM 11003]